MRFVIGFLLVAIVVVSVVVLRPDRPVPADPWPKQGAATWPARCLIENIAVHPLRPWLAAACTDSDHNRGAVLVFDADAGALRTTTPLDGYVGWSQNANVLRWHPDGARLATNAQTNGVTVLERAREVGTTVVLDDSRDTAVKYVWVDASIFADTGALFDLRPDSEGQFRLIDTGAPHLETIEWNAALGAAVGSSVKGLSAFDPMRRKLIYQVAVKDLDPISVHWSPDGRWAAHGSADGIKIFSGDDGQLRFTVKASAPSIDEVLWGPNGALMISACRYAPARRRARDDDRVDIVRAGKIDVTIKLAPREIQAIADIPEVSGMAWSPSGTRVALLVNDQRVLVLDARDGKELADFAAPAVPRSSGLPDFYKDTVPLDFGHVGAVAWLTEQYIVRLDKHFVSFWSPDGKKLAELVVPTN